MGDLDANGGLSASSVDDHQRRYRALRRLYLSALGVIASSTAFLPMALVARQRIMGGNLTEPGRYCQTTAPPGAPMRGESLIYNWTNTPLPFGIICRYGENQQIETFTDTGTPFIVAALVCLVIAVVMLIVHTRVRRRLDAEVRATYGAERATSDGASGRAPESGRQGGQGHVETSP